MNYEDRVTKEYVEGLLSGGVKIACGGYTGDGVLTKSITFPFEPMLVFIGRNAAGEDYAVITRETNGIYYTAAFGANNSIGPSAKCSYDGPVLTIWTNLYATACANGNNIPYYWYAIG